MDCAFCGTWHSSMSCFHPGRQKYDDALAKIERLQAELATANNVIQAGVMIMGSDAKEIERLQAELSWIYANCELRDRDNTHIDSDDVQSAIAAEEGG